MVFVPLLVSMDGRLDAWGHALPITDNLTGKSEISTRVYGKLGWSVKEQKYKKPQWPSDKKDTSIVAATAQLRDLKASPIILRGIVIYETYPSIRIVL